MTHKAIDGALRMYIESLVVNCQGDMAASGKSYPTFEEAIAEVYELQAPAYEEFQLPFAFMLIDPLRGEGDETCLE